MKQLIAQQVQFILLMTISGMLLMAGYDILRLIRWWIPHGKIMIAVEDVLYWMAVSIPIFYLFLIYHDGIIRWYGVVAVVSGIVLYEYAFSKPVRNRLAAILNPWKKRWKRRIHSVREKCHRQMKKVIRKVTRKWQKNIAKRKTRVYNK